MRILGLSGDYIRHDSSICLVENGKVVYACSEERFSRLKNDPRAPVGALQDMLERYDIVMDDIDAIAVGMPSFHFFKGITESGLAPLLSALLPVAFKNTKYLLGYIKERLADAGKGRSGFEWMPREKVHYISHYRAHGASAYRTSGFDNALCVTMDAAGADAEGRPLSGSVFICSSGKMELFETTPRYASMGCYYNAVTQAVGFRPIGEDWKLMGLAAFGDPQRCYREMAALAPRFEGKRWIANRSVIESKLIDRPNLLKNTWLWRELSRLVDLFGDRDVAAAAQKVFEDNLMDYFEYLFKHYKGNNIALAGGVFHNIKFCMKLKQRFKDINIFVHPAAGDVGTALGAALELYHQMTGEPTHYYLESMALGPDYSEMEISGELVKFSNLLEWVQPADIAADVAKLLAERKVIGIFQGRSEWGPRALGQRSVIADPSDPAMRDHINRGLKRREWFMPFAPSILEEDATRYLVDYFYSPFMTNAFEVTEAAKRELSSAIHRDGTARPQVVRKSVLPLYHAVISAFKELSGIGAVLNTSFNRHGLPVINAPREAIEHLLWGCIDVLSIGSFLVKRRMPEIAYKKRLNWNTDEILGKWDPFDSRLMAIREKRDRGEAS